MSNMTQKHQMSLTPPEHHWLGIIVTRPRSHTSTSWGRNNKRQFSTSISHVFRAMSQKDFLYFLKRLLILKIRYFPNQSLCGFLAYILARPYYILEFFVMILYSAQTTLWYYYICSGCVTSEPCHKSIFLMSQLFSIDIFSYCSYQMPLLFLQLFFLPFGLFFLLLSH